MLNFFKKKSDDTNSDFFGEITDSMLKKAEEAWDAIGAMGDKVADKINVKQNAAPEQSGTLATPSKQNSKADSSSEDVARQDIKLYQLPWKAPDWSSVDTNTILDPKEIYPYQLALRILWKYGGTDMRIGIFAVKEDEPLDDYETLNRILPRLGFLYIKYNSQIHQIYPTLYRELNNIRPDSISVMVDSFALKYLKFGRSYKFGNTEDMIIEAIDKAMKTAKDGKIFIEKIIKGDNGYESTGEYLDIAELMSEPIDDTRFANALFETCMGHKLGSAERKFSADAREEIKAAKKTNEEKIAQLECRYTAEINKLKEALKTAEEKANKAEKNLKSALNTISELSDKKKQEAEERLQSGKDVLVRFLYKYSSQFEDEDDFDDNPQISKSEFRDRISKEEYLALITGGDKAIKAYVQAHEDESQWGDLRRIIISATMTKES